MAPQSIPGAPGQHDVRLAIQGPAATVALLAPHAHPQHWAEAWQVVPPEPNVGQPRWYLVRIEHEGRDGIGYVVIDDVIVRDARDAGLPEVLGVTARMVVILPEAVTTTDAARWIVKQLARYIAREAGDPPYHDFDLSTWRAIVAVLVDALPDVVNRTSGNP